MIKFYDTNALLELGDSIFDEFFIISSVSLEEIEHIKESRNKSEEVKYSARNIARLLQKNADKYEVVVYNTVNIEAYLCENGLEYTPDNKICACAAWKNACLTKDSIVFITADINCYNIARNIFHLETHGIEHKTQEIYKGYKKIRGTSAEITEFMSNEGFLTNEYIIIENTAH